MINSFAELVLCGLTLVALWFAYHVCWQGALLNRLRQRVFRIRDGMFLLAAAGELSFNDPAYRILRAKANNLLHHASDVNCGKVLAVLLYCSMTKRTNWPSGADAGRDFAGLLDRMDDAQKAAKYRAIEQALMLEVGRYVLCWTPVIGCVAALVVVLIPAAIANRELTRIANGKGVQAFAQSSLLRGELDADETLCAAA